jgi:hypothetical protein
MKTVEATFKIQFTEEQYREATEYIQDMKSNPRRIFWVGKEHLSDQELIYSHLAHRILSGFYNQNNSRFGTYDILEMKSKYTS